MACLFPIHFCELHCTLSSSLLNCLLYIIFFRSHQGMVKSTKLETISPKVKRERKVEDLTEEY